MAKQMMKQGSKAPNIKSTLMGRPTSLFDEMEQMFEAFQPNRWRMSPFQREWSELSTGFEQRVPSVDVIDYDDHIQLRAELPGIDKKDVNISMTDKTVTLTGSSRKETKEEKGDYYCHEISSGSFARTMALPCLVDDTRAKASFHDGVLELNVPKLEKSTRRNIKIE